MIARVVSQDISKILQDIQDISLSERLTGRMELFVDDAYPLFRFDRNDIVAANDFFALTLSVVYTNFNVRHF